MTTESGWELRCWKDGTCLSIYKETSCYAAWSSGFLILLSCSKDNPTAQTAPIPLLETQWVGCFIAVIVTIIVHTIPILLYYFVLVCLNNMFIKYLNIATFQQRWSVNQIKVVNQEIPDWCVMAPSSGVRNTLHELTGC